MAATARKITIEPAARCLLLRQVAASLDAPAALGPHLDFLFEPLGALGSMPGLVARLLGEAGIRPGRRVLELACGKGTAAVAAAERLGCEVLGIDAYEPFVRSAGELAQRRGVAGLCRFRVGDVTELPHAWRGRYDAALMLGLAPLGEAAPVLRTLVRRGGVYMVDDVARDPRRRAGAYAHVPTADEHAGAIAGLGDRIEACVSPAPSAIRRQNDVLYRRLAKRAGELAEREPRLRAALREFLARQRGANRTLTGVLRPTVWVVRRGL